MFIECEYKPQLKESNNTTEEGWQRGAVSKMPGRIGTDEVYQNLLLLLKQTKSDVIMLIF